MPTKEATTVMKCGLSKCTKESAAIVSLHKKFGDEFTALKKQRKS